MPLAYAFTALVFLFMPASTTLYNARLEAVVDLPAGYFLLCTEDPAPDGFYSVIYDDISGFVLQSAVTPVDYRPVNKYETTVRFRCDNDGQPVNLRVAPQKSAAILDVLPSDAVGRCYGPAQGEALIPGCGTVWYYVEINGVHGYCYCAHISVDPTPPNIIEKEKDEPVETTQAEPVTQDPPQSLSRTAAIILIVALCIPIPFIMFFLFKKPKDI